MKIVKTDNYNRDYIAESLVCENINKYRGEEIVYMLNEKYGQTEDYFVLREDDYKLYNPYEEGDLNDNHAKRLFCYK